MFFPKSIFMVILSLSLFSFSNCGSTKAGDTSITFQQNPPFVIEGVTLQKTIAGIKEGGTTTRLTVPVSQVKEGVQFINLYFEDQMVEAKSSPTVKSQFLGFFTEDKKDFIMDSDATKEAANKAKITIPFNLNANQAVFSYLFDGKLNYYKISSIEALPPIALPSQNPNSSGLNKL